MIITCPSCATRYMADSATFQPHGRQVRCANCEHSWFQEPPDDYALETLPPPEHYEEIEAPEDPAARAEQSAESSRRALAYGRLVGWALLFLLIGGLAFGFMAYSTQIVQFWPKAATLYSLFGKEVNTAGIRFNSYNHRYEIQGGNTVLVIEGEVVNVTDEPKILPLFRASLRDDNDREIFDWVFETEIRELAARETAFFKTSLDNPPDEAREVGIYLADEDGADVMPLDDVE